MLTLIAALLSVSVPIASSSAHSGGLDARGCHHNRKTGGYHCHRGSASSEDRTQRLLPGATDGPFRNCAEARAAGAAPVRAGDPGYSRRLDRDGDGVGCE
jgi:hypothetical protein